MTRSLSYLIAVATMIFFFATAILGLSIPAGGAQNASQIIARDRIDMEGIDLGLMEQFEIMAQYAAAAYCTHNSNSVGDKITCEKNICPLVEESATQSLSEFSDSKDADNTGFLAIDGGRRMLVLSFRGTRSRANRHQNLKFTHIESDLCPDCHVHIGYWKAWLEMRDHVVDIVLDATERYSDFRFVITGHSLGGALATIAAGALRKLNDQLHERTELYTFGSPRFGDLDTVKFLSAQSSLSFRITNRLDIVPDLPPHEINYYHTIPQYYISHNSAHPAPSDFKVYDSYYGVEGNTRTSSVTLGIKKHRSYFMHDIAACSRKEKDHSQR